MLSALEPSIGQKERTSCPRSPVCPMIAPRITRLILTAFRSYRKLDLAVDATVFDLQTSGYATAWNVTSLTNMDATVDASAAITLIPGDEVLLTTMWGPAGSSGPGNYEFKRVASVSSNTVFFTESVRNIYGNGTNADLTGHRVILQRVPQFANVTVHAGAGAYECGEETALLDSLEGRRGQPRLKPPFPAVEGLYARPTVVNNVESIASVPSIISGGADWFAGMGTEKSKGFGIFSLSGHVTRPGKVRYNGVQLRLMPRVDARIGVPHERERKRPCGPV